MSKKERRELKKQEVERNEQELDNVSGGWMMYLGNDEETAVSGINKKTRGEEIRVFSGTNSRAQAEEYARNNLMKDPKIRIIF